MSATQTESIELTTQNSALNHNGDNNTTPPQTAATVIPDGGYGWTIAFSCSTITFFINGYTGSWGIFQTALLKSQTADSTTTLSFVGSLGLALCVVLGLFSIRLSQLIGARMAMLFGVLVMGLGVLLAGIASDSTGGLFATASVAFGVGSSVAYTLSNSLPVQWFSSKLGTVNGIVKLGGGVGATVMALAVQALIDRVGIAWTFRIFGSMILVGGVPAALLVRERVPPSRAQLVDLNLFKSLPYCCLFVAGAIGTFALFVPPFFLPLFADSIGLSTSVGAGVVAAFNACTALGRLGAGFACDRLGSTNTLLLAMAVNAISMLAIWPVSDTVGPLIVFAASNGVANGAFFVAMPTAIGRLMGPGQASVGMGMAITGWTAGYLMGSPIAGMLISATGAESAHSVAPYKGAIFYAGSIATASAILVLVARLGMDSKPFKRL